MPTRKINLTDHFESLIEDSIESGRYKKASEVVRDGLRILEDRQREDAAKLERLRGEVQVGLDALDAPTLSRLTKVASAVSSQSSVNKLRML